MKRRILSSETLKKRKQIIAATDFNSQLTDRQIITHNKKRYSVSFKDIYTGQDADPKQMLKDFKASISMITPYDNAPYAWARLENGVITIYQPKYPDGPSYRVNEIYYLNADDADVENDEWVEDVVRYAFEELEEINNKVRPNMIHNSTNIKPANNRSPFYKEVKWLYDQMKEYGAIQLQRIPKDNTWEIEFSIDPEETDRNLLEYLIESHGYKFVTDIEGNDEYTTQFSDGNYCINLHSTDDRIWAVISEELDEHNEASITASIKTARVGDLEVEHDAETGEYCVYQDGEDDPVYIGTTLVSIRDFNRRLYAEWMKKYADNVKAASGGFLPNMTYCPACGGTRFNEKTGLCVDCGYDEGSWSETGTDDYDDIEASVGKRPAHIGRFCIVVKSTNECIDSYTDRKDAADWVKYLVKEGDFAAGELEIIDTDKEDISQIVFASTTSSARNNRNNAYQYKGYVIIFSQSGCFVKDGKGKFVGIEFATESDAVDYINSIVDQSITASQDEDLDDDDIQDEWGEYGESLSEQWFDYLDEVMRLIQEVYPTAVIEEEMSGMGSDFDHWYYIGIPRHGQYEIKFKSNAEDAKVVAKGWEAAAKQLASSILSKIKSGNITFYPEEDAVESSESIAAGQDEDLDGIDEFYPV